MNESLLYIVIESNNYYLTKLLLENGANPNIITEEDNNNPFYIAIMENNNEIIQLLLDNGGIVTKSLYKLAKEQDNKLIIKKYKQNKKKLDIINI